MQAAGEPDSSDRGQCQDGAEGGLVDRLLILLIDCRQLESLIRLTEARAKMELREEATADDARDVIEIMQQSICDAMLDELGKHRNGLIWFD